MVILTSGPNFSSNFVLKSHISSIRPISLADLPDQKAPENILSSPQNLIQLRKARKVYFGAKKNENCSPKVAYRLKQLLN